MRFKRKTEIKKDAAQPEDSAQMQNQCQMSQFEASVDTSFFYTNDKIIESSDDNEILQKIQERYPQFNQSNKDTQLKKTLLSILDDDQFVEYLLEYYQMSISDLFKILYKSYSSLFNQLFINKIREKIQNKTYAE